MSSPHVLTPGSSVRTIMLLVLLALLPAIAAYYFFFGPGILISLALASVTALVAEAAMLQLRNYPVKHFLTDGSAILTAWLLALSIPPLAPWWLIVVGTAFAIIVAKHLYGGLGNNLFNPAMVGFAVLMISFPSYMTQWTAPLLLTQHPVGFSEALQYYFSGTLQGVNLDAVTMATPLDTLKTQLNLQHTVSEVKNMPIFGNFGGKGGEIVAAMYLLGGLFLLQQRIITWHTPVSFLVTLALVAALFNGIDPSRYASPMFHLFTGGAMLGAFFIATDYVTSPTTPLGKLIFGASAGFLVYVIRVFGGYPDGIAFAVLIMNAAVPLIDAYTQPRVYGHGTKPE
ncbi:electron transport complex subunit RsxD [Sulfuricella sp.]|uniref:electron transport complex subunit RsxD n=1 Tax=Sulfuricella sp. TaxID=2099377 RepID=UPI002BA099D9|nr:electron transport complex subunit RsxD [Sulfuricella sp.]HUX63839.1 electron transport complex subunit RsxD [Sulfuricella sp.]